MIQTNYPPAELHAQVNAAVSPLTTSTYDRDPLLIPKLSNGVRLIGKMNGYGFQDEQWLIDCQGKLLQVSELLFRIAEEANGVRTSQEIAANVSSSTEWSLDSTDVQKLIEAKLAPLGIVGNTVLTNEPRTSPLGINIKFRTLSPSFIEPITSVLHVLCHWTVVLIAIVASIAAHWWLYGGHGVSRGVQDAIYTPGGVLLAIGVLLVAAFFHEFGHASALRHHGGRVGNMGIALYIIYPALYTDVTDNYRLSRWARVSTDLGGIYFHLIFAIALFGAYFISHRELYLFCVLLIDLAIIEQFIPVIRLDGYWLLCDLTGIPDLFSFMAPSIKNSIPSQAGHILDAVTGKSAAKGSRLPDLKPWVKAVLITYMVITVPILTYVFVEMIISLPELVSTAWGGLQAQITILKILSIRHDLVTAVLVVLQILFLVMPVPATIYFLYITLKPSLNRFLDWASRTRRNTLAGATAIAACSGVAFAFILLPSIRPFHRTTDSAGTAAHLIHTTQEATSHLNSITAEIEGSIGEDHYRGTMELQRPNLARVDIHGTKGLGNILVVSDGKTATTYFADTNQYVQIAPGANGEFIESTVVQQVQRFFHPESLQNARGLRYLGHRSTEGTDYDVVEVEDASTDGETTSYFISRKDRLIYRTVQNVNSGGRPHTWLILKNVHKNTPIDIAAFSWSLPRAATQLQMPAGIQLPTKP